MRAPPEDALERASMPYREGTVHKGQPDAERKQEYTAIEVPVPVSERVRAYIEALSQGDDDVEG